MNNHRRVKRFDKSPLIEAVFEVRFEPTQRDRVTLVPGLVEQNFPDLFDSVDALDILQLPPDMRNEPKFRFNPYYKLSGDDIVFLVGPNMILIASGNHYVGWDKYSKYISDILNFLKGINLFKSIIRYSIKYVNVIEEAEISKQLGLMALDATICNSKINSLEGLNLRVPFDEDQYRVILGIQTAVAATRNSIDRFGLYFDVDVIVKSPDPNFLNNHEEVADNLHEIAEKYFLSGLKSETIDALGPTFEEGK